MNHQLDFSDWFKFDDYLNRDDRKLPGVYVLAHFGRKPTSPPLLTSNKVIYIGETTKQNLHKRLYQFSNSAFKRKNGHSGGWTYSKMYLDDTPIEGTPNELYVSFLSVDMGTEESKAYIKYVERLLIWKYFKKNNDYPPCNIA